MTTVGEWGAQLPHGVVRGNAVQRSFTLRRQDVRLDLEVGSIRESSELRKHVGRLLSTIVATVCEEIAGVPTGQPTKAAIDLVNSLPPSDVIYILIYRACLRNRGRVPVPPILLPCPHCGAFVGQLKHPSMERVPLGVYEWEPGDHPVGSVVLTDPIPYKAKLINALAAVCTTWGAHIGSCATDVEVRNDALLRQKALSAIQGYRFTDGTTHHGPVTQEALRQLMSWDAEGVAAAATATWGGLTFAVPVEHTCGEEVFVPFDWRSGLL